MKTDYQKLNSFEGFVIIFAALGVVLIAWMMLMSMPLDQQNNFRQGAVSILDVHREVDQQLQTARTAVALGNRTLDQMVVAFEQVTAVPGSDLSGLKNLAEIGNQAANKILSLHPPASGRVLGASIERSVDPPENLYPAILAPANLSINLQFPRP